MRKPGPARDALTLLRAQLLLDVTAGKKTSTEAAAALGVSRKTWHAWQRRGLQGMMDGLSGRPRGRPAQVRDPEKEELRKQNAALRARVAELERSLLIRKVAGRPMPEPPGPGCLSKKKRQGRRTP